MYLAIFLALVTLSCASAPHSPVPAASSVSAATSTRPTVAPNPGFVSLNFDDGYESAYLNALPILDQAGLKSTQFIITGFLGNSGYVTTDQVLAMRANGHEIGAHTRSHPHLSTLTDDQQQSEILGSFDDLVSLGVRPAFFAYPYGDYNSTSIYFARMVFLGARTTVFGDNDKSANPLLLNCYSVRLGSTLYAIGDITRLIDVAQANGTWLVLLFHRVDETGDPNSVPHDLIQQVVDYLVARQVRVVTMSQGFQMVGLPSP